MKNNLGQGMKIIAFALIALALAACDQTLNQAGSEPVLAAAPPVQELPPIYMPWVEMHRVKDSKYRIDLAACRTLGAPQERVARDAIQQAQVGAMISLAGDVIGAVPGANFKEAHALRQASGALRGVGGSAAAGGASTADVALNDYALVVNSCLHHRGYVLLR